MKPTPPDAPVVTPSVGMLVVDDHELVRIGLRSLAESYAASKGQTIHVFEARTLQDALSIYQDHQPKIDLVLLDMHLPDAHGLSGLTAFITRFPGARVIVLSGVSDSSMAQEAVACGALTYFSKSADLPNVMEFLNAKGIWGGVGLQKRAHETMEGTRTVRTIDGHCVDLAPRQALVFDCILAGRSNREIAQMMHLSEGTVKNHVSALLLLFGVRSRAQLISQLR